jgi:hypothetical protein
MKVIITSDVRRHNRNKHYPCLLVVFGPNDAFDPDRLNWMPRFQDLEKIIREMCKLDPGFVGVLEGVIQETLVRLRGKPKADTTDVCPIVGMNIMNQHRVP